RGAPGPALFPYTTLFRSPSCPSGGQGGSELDQDAVLGPDVVRLGREGDLREGAGEPDRPAGVGQAAGPDRVGRRPRDGAAGDGRSEEHTSELLSQSNLVC